MNKREIAKRMKRDQETISGKTYHNSQYDKYFAKAKKSEYDRTLHGASFNRKSNKIEQV